MSALTVHDLLEDVKLLRIGSVELGALRSNSAQDGVDQNQTIDPDYNLQIYGRDDDRGFRVILRTELTFDGGRIVSEVEAEYQLNKLLFSQISEATYMEFANEVSIMSILPYTRASIADITIRVFDAALLMPIIERGQITFKTEKAHKIKSTASNNALAQSLTIEQLNRPDPALTWVRSGRFRCPRPVAVYIRGMDDGSPV